MCLASISIIVCLHGQKSLLTNANFKMVYGGHIENGQMAITQPFFVRLCQNLVSKYMIGPQSCNLVIKSHEPLMQRASSGSVSLIGTQGSVCHIFTGEGGGKSFDWRLATIADREVAKLVPWNSLLN